MDYKQPTLPFSGVIICSTHCHMTVCLRALKQLGLFMGFFACNNTILSLKYKYVNIYI